MSDPELIPVEDRPAVLTIAGLDPSAGAGITTDEAVIRAWGVHPLIALTGVAIQNTARLARRFDLPPEVLREQLDVLTEEFLLGAVKTGMLGRVATVESVGSWLAERPRLPVVVDPVLRSSSGGPLGEDGMAAAIIRTLLPRARVITPNLEEAALLSGREVKRRDDVPEAARALRDLGANWVLIKGGHLARGRASDFLSGPDGEIWMEEDMVEHRSVRGTGCALAAGIAAGLARGDSVADSARMAKTFVTRAINQSYVAGHGRFLEISGGRSGRAASS
jgi:hydroxymethylpyrimidine/phosphomethylpyrimidine kinase